MQFKFVTTNETKTEQYENPCFAQGEIRTIARRVYLGQMHQQGDDTLEIDEADATELQ